MSTHECVIRDEDEEKTLSQILLHLVIVQDVEQLRILLMMMMLN
jgi:hypothetical protein